MYSTNNKWDNFNVINKLEQLVNIILSIELQFKAKVALE